MKVICINGKKEGNLTYFGNPLKKEDAIYEGEVYSVLREIDHPNGPSYILEDKSPYMSYRKIHFIPLSTIDESTFERNYNTQPC